MILYLDSSSLVKRYVEEPGWREVAEAVETADLVGTVVVSRVEVAAALSKAVRLEVLAREEAWKAMQVFREEWPELVSLQITELLISRAETLAWDYGLRGYYDAVQLAAASVWQEMMGERVTLSTFDRRLWATAQAVGLEGHPADLPDLLAAWQAPG
jgi:predicted nucleic acid-binding protein